MKVQKIFTLEMEVVKMLNKEANQSALVNELLANHYKDPRTEEQIIKAVKDKINAKAQAILDKRAMEEKVAKRVKEMKAHKKKGVSFQDPRE